MVQEVKKAGGTAYFQHVLACFSRLLAGKEAWDLLLKSVLSRSQASWDGDEAAILTVHKELAERGWSQQRLRANLGELRCKQSQELFGRALTLK